MWFNSAVSIKPFFVLCCCAMFLVAARHAQLSELTSRWSITLIMPQNTKTTHIYDWSQSTEENYKSDVDCQHCDKYTAIRKTLDYAYHSKYTKERQLVQFEIIDALLNETLIEDLTSGENCTTSSQPWVVFTAGCMGAGKSWTIRHLNHSGDFPLGAFVSVDPDEIRRRLPEFETYARIEPERAGEWTGKEAGMMSEILTLAALEKGHNVLVDGSLRNSMWYQSYFTRLKQDYAHLRIGILHISAPPEVVYARAASRAKRTGRVIPRATLEESMLQVPKSVRQLSPLADFYAQLHNTEDGPIAIEAPSGLTWQAFREAWTQSCDSDASERRRLQEETETCSDDAPLSQL